ncbi:MAG: formimidoylglutamate deiminase [Acidobacteriota bacterium]
MTAQDSPSQRRSPGGGALALVPGGIPLQPPYRLAPELAWIDGAFRRHRVITVEADGRLGEISSSSGTESSPRESLPQLISLPGRALLPGFVNAHSHAFQRGLRGWGESFPAGAGSFWSWREAMYGLVERLDEDAFTTLCHRAFQEMRAAGITTVGEFHYFRHGPSVLDIESPSGADPYDYDELVADAASAAGIRLVLLAACYLAGGPGRPLERPQRRFRSTSPAAYWRSLDRLQERLHRPHQHLGAVVHSLRAVDPAAAAEVRSEAKRRGLVLHLHLEEQIQEIEELQAATGRRPMDLVLERLDPGPDLTAVHCTHTPPEALQAFAETGAAVCLCPLTEANLGDGISRVDSFLKAGGLLCLGTDSNARISMLEEMRWTEYGQRLGGQRRGALADAQGRVSNPLLQAATEGGARALGIDAGRLAPGAWADLALVSLDHPQLLGASGSPAEAGDAPPPRLEDALVFGAGDGVFDATAVAGSWRLHGPGSP